MIEEQGTNLLGMHYVQIMIFFWHNDRVATYLLNSDIMVGVNTSTADDIHKYLAKIDVNDEYRGFKICDACF